VAEIKKGWSKGWRKKVTPPQLTPIHKYTYKSGVEWWRRKAVK